MSLMDTLKGLVGKGREVAAENADKISGAVDKAGGFIDEKTGGKYSEKIGKGAAALKNAIPEQAGSAESEPAAQAAPAPEPAAPAAEPQAEPVAEPTPPAPAQAESEKAESEKAAETESAPDAAPPSETKPEPGQG
ncbi:antitoxin [Nocardia miyunensis]|uniref:antitoxin n=1 Tax=Nocardia miyunensis TaxID=282684 RepID=UPI00082DE77E